MEQCKYEIAWVGICKNTAEEGSEFCEVHSKEVCCSCGAQATKQCSETAQFVCGFPLCNDCEHTTQSNGCNSGGELPEGLKGHCKIEDQVYKPWYMKENESDLYLK